MWFPLFELDAAIEKHEQDLHSVAQWCFENYLLINPDKTKLLFLGTRQILSRLPEDPNVIFVGETLIQQTLPKTWESSLTPIWPTITTFHLVVSSCFAKLCQINRVKRSFDKETLQLLITPLVFSKMLYCSSVWSNTTLQNINRLQSIQNFASKIVTNSRKFDHVTPLLRELNWLPVKEQLFYRDSVLTFKCKNGLAPQYLTSTFTKRSNIHTRYTRTRNTLQIPLCRTATGQRTFFL